MFLFECQQPQHQLLQIPGLQLILEVCSYFLLLVQVQFPYRTQLLLSLYQSQQFGPIIFNIKINH